QATLNLVDPARFSFVILVGDLDYYARVGFGVALANVRLPGPVDPVRLLIRAEKAVFEQ
ncbi:MAG: N-acetyltransferase, partial [Pseudomonadota bacterium]|nr:N-acetyltransferase [Pseudomonadota bacterium]